MEYIQTINSPVGKLTVSSDGENICGLWIEGQKYFSRTLEQDICEKELPVFNEVKKWLALYFSGKNPGFMPPVVFKGSQFQKSVWNCLCGIPYGETISYGELAKKVESHNAGKKTSARAIGGAVGHNPVSIIVPCHRVIGKNGALTGYAGGVDIKEKLLRLEGIVIKKQ